MRLLLGVGVPALVALLALNLVIPEMQQYRHFSKQEELRVAKKSVKRAANACSSKVTYDRIKNLAFDEAVKVRRADARNLHRLAAFSVIRMESPIVKSRDESLDVTVCSGRFVLEIPPGAERGFNGERQLRADVEYTAQSAADGSGLIYQLAGADPIIYKLAAFDLKGHKFAPRAESLLLADAQTAPPVTAPQTAARPADVAAPAEAKLATNVPAPSTTRVDEAKPASARVPDTVRKATVPVRRTAAEVPRVRVASIRPASRKEKRPERERQPTAKRSAEPVRLARMEEQPRHRPSSSPARKTKTPLVRVADSIGRVARARPLSALAAAKPAIRHAVGRSVVKRGEMAVLRGASAANGGAYRPVAEARKATRPAQFGPAKPTAPEPKMRPVQIAQAAAKRPTVPAKSKIHTLSAVVRGLFDEPPPRPKQAPKPQPSQAAAAAPSKPRLPAPQPVQVARVETSRIIPVPRTVRAAEVTAAPRPSPAARPAPAMKPAPVQVATPVRPQQQATSQFQTSRCGYARSMREEMVCMNGRLASLDRSVARLYQSALDQSGGQARYELRRTQDGFLSYLNRCRNEACLADAFQGRMEEIRDIVVGRWRG